MDDLQVTNRINAAFHVSDLRLLEDAHNMIDAINRFDVGQERIAKALSL